MKIIRKNLVKIILLVILIVIVGGLFFREYLSSSAKSDISMEEDVLEVEEEMDLEQEKVEEIVKVHVDIKGAIKNPGVYELDSTKKIIDVVNLAGGLLDKADTSLVNLAKKVTDEMVVIIYTKEEIKDAKAKGELSLKVNDSCVCPTISNDACLNNNGSSEKSKSSSNSKSTTTTKSDEKININTATLEELQTLSGVGEGKAKAIISYREENGNFSSIEDILNVSGIGESIYEKIKNNITV